MLRRNGMSKATTIASVMGIRRPTAGQVHFDGVRLDGLPPDRIARHGLGLVAEGRQVFPRLTVHENLVATASTSGVVRAVWTEDRIFTLFPWLRERRHAMAALPSGGEQQVPAIGRAPAPADSRRGDRRARAPGAGTNLMCPGPVEARGHGDPAG